MSKHTKLTKEDRIEISTLLKSGRFTLSAIAKQIGKHKSTISRELSRNKDLINNTYNYSIAHTLSKERKAKANKLRSKIVLNGGVEEHIIAKLKTNWSPEQIAGRLKVKSDTSLSHQTIYNYIYLYRPEWKKFLRILGSKGKYRRKYGTKIREKLREEEKKKRIDTRPEIIETRKRLGDWEGDTIVGLEKTIHILTYVDRKSGFLLANKAEEATAEKIQELTLKAFQKIPKTKLKSITYDNGTQFAKHEDTEEKIQKLTKDKKFSIYFAYPYHSWERGTNENTNGLLRQYFPKKTLFKNITQKELDKVVNLINDRPRKRLNYLTPKEVFKEKSFVAIRD
jgi:IS30 family transposase